MISLGLYLCWCAYYGTSWSCRLVDRGFSGRFSEDKSCYFVLLPIPEFRTICWVLVGRRNPPRPPRTHRYHRRCQCFLQFWWVIQCCYTACIFTSLLSICIPPQPPKPVTSGDIASQPASHGPDIFTTHSHSPPVPQSSAPYCHWLPDRRTVCRISDYPWPTRQLGSWLHAKPTTHPRKHAHTPKRSLLTQAHDSPI